jgi:hypothetical protein
MQRGAGPCLRAALAPPAVDRKPSLTEFVESGAVNSAGQLWWAHREYQLKDGRWGAGIVGYQYDGGSIAVTEVHPAAGQDYFPTQSGARAMNVQLGRWFCTVNAPSPSRPIATTVG